MARRDPRSARLLGLWTAGWLAVLLVTGLLWLGDLSLQWPVLAVPALWALVALRPRRRAADDRYGDAGDRYDADDRYDPDDRYFPDDRYRPDDRDDPRDRYDPEDDWEPVPAPDRSSWPHPVPGHRTDTVERSAVDGSGYDPATYDPATYDPAYDPATDPATDPGPGPAPGEGGHGGSWYRGDRY